MMLKGIYKMSKQTAICTYEYFVVPEIFHGKEHFVALRYKGIVQRKSKQQYMIIQTCYCVISKVVCDEKQLVVL